MRDLSTPDTPSPGQQWYAWFVAQARQPHQHPPWDKLSPAQQTITTGLALREWEWACDPGARAYTTLSWQFAKGDAVVLPGNGGTGVVRQQRATLRDIFSPILEYLVEPHRGLSGWYYEADLIAAEREDDTHTSEASDTQEA